MSASVAWQPGVPIYAYPTIEDDTVNGSFVRPIFQLLSEGFPRHIVLFWCEHCAVGGNQRACWMCGRRLT